jgi:hypothetical protein
MVPYNEEGIGGLTGSLNRPGFAGGLMSCVSMPRTVELVTESSGGNVTTFLTGRWNTERLSGTNCSQWLSAMTADVRSVLARN